LHCLLNKKYFDFYFPASVTPPADSNSAEFPFSGAFVPIGITEEDQEKGFDYFLIEFLFNVD
jgi:hypothetical protein